VTEYRGTAHELRPRLFLIFVVNSLLLQGNSTPLQFTPFLLCTVFDKRRTLEEDEDKMGNMVDPYYEL